MRRRFLLLSWLAVPLYASGQSQPQNPRFTLRIADRISGRPLQNAEVLQAGGERLLSNEKGEVFVQWPAGGDLVIRVRQVGFTPFQGTVRREQLRDGVALIELSRITYLRAVVRGATHCPRDADSASSIAASVLEQVRQGAEKYEQFSRRYPFKATVNRRTAILSSGRILRMSEQQEEFRSDSWEGRYRPGAIIERPGRGRFHVPLLFLSTLADSTFWENHCFRFGDVHTTNGARVIRLEFSPNSRVKGPDWEGAAVIDSATSLLRRVDFRVAQIASGSAVRRLEGYITFASPSPFVVMPDSTVAMWWTRRSDTVGWPDFAQSLHVAKLEYRQSPPP